MPKTLDRLSLDDDFATVSRLSPASPPPAPLSPLSLSLSPPAAAFWRERVPKQREEQMSREGRAKLGGERKQRETENEKGTQSSSATHTTPVKATIVCALPPLHHQTHTHGTLFVLCTRE